MSAKFPVRVVKACYVGGKLVLAGQQLSVGAEVVADLLRASRVVLLDENDLRRIAAAGREAELRFASMTRTGGRGDANPWQRLP